MSAATTPDPKLGEILYPRNCRVGVSPDKSQLAFTFTSPTHSPVTLVLPLAGAVGLQQKLARSLILLGVRPLPPRRKGAPQNPTKAASDTDQPAAQKQPSEDTTGA